MLVVRHIDIGKLKEVCDSYGDIVNIAIGPMKESVTKSDGGFSNVSLMDNLVYLRISLSISITVSLKTLLLFNKCLHIPVQTVPTPQKRKIKLVISNHTANFGKHLPSLLKEVENRYIRH
jgi:hypothetical protein